MEPEHLALGDTNELARQIRKAIGADDYEDVLLMLPQFERPSGKECYLLPQDADEIDALKEAPSSILLDIGLRIWTVKNRIAYWLFPGEWYDHIPDGYEVLDIFGEKEAFRRGRSDDDIRFGCLSYGFARPAEAQEGDGEDD